MEDISYRLSRRVTALACFLSAVLLPSERCIAFSLIIKLKDVSADAVAEVGRHLRRIGTVGINSFYAEQPT